MPIKDIGGLKVAVTDYSLEKIYWPQLTRHFKDKYGNLIFTDANKVQEVLKECFEFLCDKFMKVLTSENRASFFIFVHYLHEDSIEIYRKQLNGEQVSVDEENFAGTRRILKYILEQGCHLKMKGHPIFIQEICENKDKYEKHLDELLYLGQKAFELMEYTARSQLFPKSTRVGISENQITTFTDPPFNSIFAFIFNDIKKHNHKVELSDCLLELKTILSKEIGINYDDVAGYFFEQIKDPKQRFGAISLDKLIDFLNSKFGYPKDILGTFYSGLTISDINALSIQECFLRTQDTNRYTYRPILKYNIDGKYYHFVGANKWLESLALIGTNCIPFGQYPKEWLKLKPLSKFMARVSNTHDKILEDPAISLLTNAGWKIDRNIKYLRKRNNQNISIIKKNLGEIDLLFIDEEFKTIYVAECKDNRARFEYNNWKRDIYNFNDTYEPQLKNKYQWIEQNTLHVLEHFEILYNTTINDKNNYIVKPIFLINAPTLYMYDSSYLTLTLYELERLINRNHTEVEFNGALNGKEIHLRKPYFKNLNKLI